MKNRLLLLIIAIVQTIFGWVVIKEFIIVMSLGQFIIVEILISILHGMYNRAKRDLIKQL